MWRTIEILAIGFVYLLVLSVKFTNHHRLHPHQSSHQHNQQERSQRAGYGNNEFQLKHPTKHLLQSDNIGLSTNKPLVDGNNNNYNDYQQSTMTNEQRSTLVDTNQYVKVQKLCQPRCSSQPLTKVESVTKHIVLSTKEDNSSNDKLNVEKKVTSSICGSDKKFYPTYCHMQRASCITRRVIHPSDPDVCRSSGLDDSKNGGKRIVSQTSDLSRQQNQKIKRNDLIDDRNDVITDEQIDQDDLDDEQDELIDNDLEAILMRNNSYYDIFKLFEISKLENKLQPELTNNSDTTIDISKHICNRQLYNQMLFRIVALTVRNSSDIFRYFDRNHDLKISPNELLLDNDQSSSFFYVVRNEQLPINIRGNYILEPLFDDNPCSLSHILLYEDRNRDDALDLNEMTTAFQSISPNIASRQKTFIDEPTTQNRAISSYLNHHVNLGDTYRMSCDLKDKEGNYRIEWLRNGVQIGGQSIDILQQSKMDTTNKLRQITIDQEDWSLLLRDIQLFMTGNYTCRGQTNLYSPPPAVIYEQHHYLHVFVPPKVTVRPAFQWAPIGSQAQLECQYEYLSLFTNDGVSPIKIRWFKNGQELEDEKSLEAINKYQTSNSTSSVDDAFYEYDSQSLSIAANTFPEAYTNESVKSVLKVMNSNKNDAEGMISQLQTPEQQAKRSSVSVSMSSSRLTIAPLTQTDTGLITCHASLDFDGPSGVNSGNNSMPSDKSNKLSLSASDYGSLLVQDKPAQIVIDELDSGKEHLWLFHDNGITIYSISMNGADDQIQLIREFTGHDTIEPQIDNNWNQLTLCGGLNPEESVICEWSDNAVSVRPDYLTPHGSFDQRRRNRRGNQSLGYIYVGQPNLNRVLVFDSQQFEIVSILNTDPQPKQLWLYNTMDHMPKVNQYGTTSPSSPAKNYRNKKHKHGNGSNNNINRAISTRSQFGYDIWILCHGQPLVVDTTNTSNSNVNHFNDKANVSSDLIKNYDKKIMPIKYGADNQSPRISDKQKSTNHWQQEMVSKEQRLRNRKSVQIIRATTGTNGISNRHGDRTLTTMTNNRRWIYYHHHVALNKIDRNQSDEVNSDSETHTATPMPNSLKRFKSTISISKYHLKSNDLISLIHELYMPSVAAPLVDNHHHRVQYAYVSHYDERKLVRIDLKIMATDNIFELGDCVPVYQLTTATGLLIIQCRAPITHQLKGQLILDQLTNSFMSYNPDIQAQRSFLSPDHRYLISIYTDYNYSDTIDSRKEPKNYIFEFGSVDMRSENQTAGKRFSSSKIIVQKIEAFGLRFQYDVNTSLSIIDCAFVWKNGDYDAILVSDLGRQNEILSLRLLDGRVELISGILGRISNQRSSLKVSDRSKMAAVATSNGVYVLDMEENRVKCQVPKHHQFTPTTMLWA